MLLLFGAGLPPPNGVIPAAGWSGQRASPSLRADTRVKEPAMTDSQSDEHVAPAEFTYRGPRPGVVSGAAAIQIVFGILAIILTLSDLSALGHDAADGLTVDGFYYAIDYVQLAFSVAQVAVAVFLLRGHRWARVATLVFCGLGLFLAVAAVFVVSVLGGLFAMLINGGIIWLLVRPDAQEWFTE